MTLFSDVIVAVPKQRSLSILKPKRNLEHILKPRSQVHMLYLNRDRTLHDCVDIESGDARDSELVQDYKRLSKRLNQAQGGEKVGYAQAEVPAVSASGDRVMLGLNNSHNSGKTRDSFKMRNGHGNASNNVPTKPKQFLFTRSDSSSSSDEEEYDW